MTNFKMPVPDQPKMKVEVWSDIMCPFCYIGKRNYESALKQFDGRDRVELQTIS
jgi:predicted DsbA family dithiol-disulfide isomerase